MSTFLDDLKNSVETGAFNSEAAKKIIDISKNADYAKGLLLTEEEKAAKIEKINQTMNNNLLNARNDPFKGPCFFIASIP